MAFLSSRCFSDLAMHSTPKQTVLMGWQEASVTRTSSLSIDSWFPKSACISSPSLLRRDSAPTLFRSTSKEAETTESLVCPDCPLSSTASFTSSTGYNHWRQWCGLSRAADFDSLVDIADPGVRSKFRTVYRYATPQCIQGSCSIDDFFEVRG